MRYELNEKKELIKIEESKLSIETPWVKYILQGHDKKMKRDVFIFVGKSGKHEIRVKSKDAGQSVFPAVIINNDEKNLVAKVSKFEDLLTSFAKTGSQKELKKLGEYVGYELKVIENK